MPSPVRVQVAPAVISWAIKRSQREDYLRQKYSKLDQWENGELQPTMKQLASFAKDARVAQGYLYLSEPPDDKFPIPDLRTIENLEIKEPSPDLIDTIYACQRRQNWYREYLLIYDDEPLDYVGSVGLQTPPKEVAHRIRDKLRFESEVRAKPGRWADQLRLFIQRIEEVGVMVMVNGVVGNNTHRKLNPAEFRGFALADDLAPVVFVNGADAQAAQLFTLAHEMAHIWLGESAVSDTSWTSSQTTEIWCNKVAAEVLAPTKELLKELGNDAPLERVQNLAESFNVSQIVILWRLVDIGRLKSSEFDPDDWIHEISSGESDKDDPVADDSQGGNFYYSLIRRVGRRFGRALVASTLEGETLYRDAFRMLGIGKTATFHKFAEHLGYKR